MRLRMSWLREWLECDGDSLKIYPLMSNSLKDLVHEKTISLIMQDPSYHSRYTLLPEIVAELKQNERKRTPRYVYDGNLYLFFEKALEDQIDTMTLFESCSLGSDLLRVEFNFFRFQEKFRSEYVDSGNTFAAKHCLERIKNTIRRCSILLKFLQEVLLRQKYYEFIRIEIEKCYFHEKGIMKLIKEY